MCNESTSWINEFSNKSKSDSYIAVKKAVLINIDKQNRKRGLGLYSETVCLKGATMQRRLLSTKYHTLHLQTSWYLAYLNKAGMQASGCSLSFWGLINSDTASMIMSSQTAFSRTAAWLFWFVWRRPSSCPPYSSGRSPTPRLRSRTPRRTRWKCRSKSWARTSSQVRNLSRPQSFDLMTSSTWSPPGGGKSQSVPLTQS